jgi:beta-lactamase superfamily II metal-dependent hydrolase
MALPEVIILDVGHGNCAVVVHEHESIIVDAAPGDVLQQFLNQRGVTRIAAVLVSHADEDHLGGVIGLLLDENLSIVAIHVNPDALRDTATWRDFRHALAFARQNYDLRVVPALGSRVPEGLGIGGVTIEVLSPGPEVALGGVGGRDLGGRRLAANSLSAVVRLVYEGVPQVLLPGDLDAIGLRSLLQECAEPRARVLVFPHHGGLAGRDDPAEFAAHLCEAVRPDLVIFSIGRGRHGTPRPEIIEAVRAALPGGHIACTQLSERCAGGLPFASGAYIDARPAKGRLSKSCCAGSLEISLSGELTRYHPSAEQHTQFIQVSAPTALCQGRADPK